MHQWQYSSLLCHEDGYVIQAFHDPNRADIQIYPYPDEDLRLTLRRRLSELGQDGWELVNILIHTDIGEEWVFKRPVF